MDGVQWVKERKETSRALAGNGMMFVNRVDGALEGDLSECGVDR